MSKTFDILSLGSVYLDINCLNFPLDHHLTIETEVVGQEYRTEIGGSAVISAKVAAAMGLKPLFIGKVGADRLGTVVQELFAQSGIQPALIVDTAVQTNLGLNFINPHGQTLFTVVGTANQSLQTTEVMTKLSEMLPQVKYLYLGGYFKLKQLIPYYPEIMSLAQQNHTAIILDHGRVTNTATPEEIESLQKIVMHTDYYFPSEDEFLTVWHSKSVEEGLKKIRSSNSTVTIAVKRSSQGATSISPSGEIISVPSFKVKPINTVGAGDSFNTGFLKAHQLNKDLAECLKWGCATAALKISQPILPSLTQIEQMVQS